jgi:hypothetical protein
MMAMMMRRTYAVDAVVPTCGNEFGHGGTEQ